MTGQDKKSRTARTARVNSPHPMKCRLELNRRTLNSNTCWTETVIVKSIISNEGCRNGEENKIAKEEEIQRGR